MRDFQNNRGGGFRGNRYGGNRRDNRGGDRPMYQAVCSNCGRDCEVPFKPTGEKPVLCRDCFAMQRESEQPRGSFERRERPRGSFERREQPGPTPQPAQDYSRELEALDKKLDTILDVVLNMKKELKKNTSRTISVSEMVDQKDEFDE